MTDAQSVKQGRQVMKPELEKVWEEYSKGKQHADKDSFIKGTQALLKVDGDLVEAIGNTIAEYEGEDRPCEYCKEKALLIAKAISPQLQAAADKERERIKKIIIPAAVKALPPRYFRKLAELLPDEALEGKHE